MELPFDSFASELFAAFGVAFAEFVGVPMPGGLLLVGIAAAEGPASAPILILAAAAGAMTADLSVVAMLNENFGGALAPVAGALVASVLLLALLRLLRRRRVGDADVMALTAAAEGRVGEAG